MDEKKNEAVIVDLRNAMCTVPGQCPAKPSLECGGPWVQFIPVVPAPLGVLSVNGKTGKVNISATTSLR